MTDEAQLREKLRKIEALFAGADTVGEKLAAEAALERVRARLAELERSDKPIEMGTVRNLVCGAIVTPTEGAYGDQERHPGPASGRP